MLLVATSSVHLSYNRSEVRTDKNVRIIEVILYNWQKLISDSHNSLKFLQDV